MLRRIIAMILSTVLIGSSLTGSFAFADAPQSTFYDELCDKYGNIEIVNKTEVRWWMAAGTHTDETVKSELQAIYDAGFRGVELCQLADSTLDAFTYGYGSDQWEHDVKLILNTALDLGMTVSLTSGAGWSTANVPGLDPDSQAANQCIVLLTEDVAAGASRTGAIPTSTNLRSAAEFVGAVAVQRTTATKVSKDFLIKQTRAGSSDPTEFTIESDFIIDNENAAICFGVRDTSDSFVMLQINTVNSNTGQVLLRPHVRANGSWKTSTNIDVTSAVGYSAPEIIGKKIHIKITVKDGVVYTYFNGSDTVAATYTLPATVVGDSNGNFTLGKLMFRQSMSSNANTNEVARWDNIVVTDSNGNTVFSEDFEDAGNIGFSTERGTNTVDGMFRVGEYLYVPESTTITDAEYLTLQTRASTSDPTTFTVEGDFIINKQTTSLCFGTRNSGKDSFMLQISTIQSGGDAIYMRPHTRINGSWKNIGNIDVTEAIGHTSSTVIGKTVHMRVEVTNGSTYKVYFNGNLAYTGDLPSTLTKNENGEFSVGSLMFRNKTSSKYSNEDLSVWDNIIVTDGEGTVIFSEDFEDAENVGFEIETGSKVVDGALLLGVPQPEATAGDTVYEAENYIDLTPLVKDGTLDWQVPYDRNYTIMYYYSQGTAQSASPAVETSYTVNYFDSRGVEVLKSYLLENVLNDSELNKKIKNGDVQFFMDSLEYNSGKGITAWTEDFIEEFKERKGYDVLPYMYLTSGAPTTSIWGWNDNADLIGTYTVTDSALNKQIINDIFDVQTELYMEEFMMPFKEWLNSYEITLRAQISYGKNLEISEPISSVDYPEAENRNQNNQVDMYRLWSGGSHLQNKVLSSETGGLNNSAYSYTYQQHLQEAYSLYASGYSRIIWHIWSSDYGPTASWPGYEGGNGKQIYYKFGSREPSYSEYGEFNEHLGRVQQLLREGTAGVDIGMIYTKYGQHMVHSNAKDWMHTHQTMFFPSTELQDNGYTYDYLAPDLLTADGVYYDEQSKTLELAGYKALVLWQEVLSADSAETILGYATKGLPVVIVDGAATVNTYNDGKDGELAAAMESLKKLSNVVTVSSANEVLEALKELGIEPYIGYSEANQQLLTQTRRDGDNRYFYAYNYCDGSLHNVTNADHGERITTKVVADGIFVPYIIDSWTGEVTKLASYTYKDGKTVFDIMLDYGDVALYALEAVEAESVHVLDGIDAYERNGEIVYKATESGDYSITISNGDTASGTATVPECYDITDWRLTVESWTPSDELLTRTETLLGVTTNEYVYATTKTDINVTLDTLTTWDNIESIGNSVSGKGTYTAKFNWSGEADGAYIDFGTLPQSMQVYINGKKTDNVNMNVPTVDVSKLLVEGENTIEIRYSSNLNNVQLSRGVISEGILPSNFLGYETGYESYGVTQAKVVPYVQTVVYSEAVIGSAGPNAAYSFDIETGVLTIEGTGEVWKGVDAEYKDQVKEVVIGEDITTLTDCLFCDYYTSLEKITLPSTLTTIGNWAFFGTALTEIALPEALTSVGDYAFYGVALEDVTYAGTRAKWNGVTIGTNNEALNIVVCDGEISEAITETAQWTFDGVDTLYIAGTGYYTADKNMIPNDIAENIKHIVIDNTFAGFGAYSFTNLANLETVTGGENMRYLGIWAFSGLTKLTTVEFTSSELFGVLGYGAFSGCSSLDNVTLSDSLKVIGGAAFKNCTSLTSIVIPENITVVAHRMFEGCTALETVEIKGAAELENDVFYGCTSLKSVTLSEGLTTVGAWCFAGARVETLTLPSTLTAVGDYAFYWTTLGTVNYTGDISNVTVGTENSRLTDKI